MIWFRAHGRPGLIPACFSHAPSVLSPLPAGREVQDGCKQLPGLHPFLSLSSWEEGLVRVLLDMKKPPQVLTAFSSPCLLSWTSRYGYRWSLNLLQLHPKPWLRMACPGGLLGTQLTNSPHSVTCEGRINSTSPLNPFSIWLLII